MSNLKAILFLIGLLWFSTLRASEPFTAIHLNDVLDSVTQQPLVFREQGRVFGYNSTDSCLYGNQDVLVLENYCSPQRTYPARSYTILSLKLGIVHLYEEKMGSLTKRDIVIQTFPEAFQAFRAESLENLKIKDINTILKYFYDLQDPSCWVTNAKYGALTPGAGCNNTNLDLFAEWSKDSMQIVTNSEAWASALNRIKNNLTKHITKHITKHAVKNTVKNITKNTATQSSSVALENLGAMNKYPNTGYSACWGYTAPDGREYALLGLTNGLSIVDITNAPQLNEVAFIANTKSSPWTEMKTYKSYAYVVKDGARAGIQIIDLSDLPRSATLVNTVMDYPTNHTVWVDEARGWLFAMGGDNTGVTVWNLSPDPAHPRQIVNFNGSTYVHDLYVHGNRAYLSEIMSKSFSIYDISDIENPRLIKRVRDATAPGVSFHNSWTTDDGRYLLTTEETRGRPVRIWDLTDETNPVEVSRWIGPGDLAHNVHVKGNFAHVAHYGGGYRVVDISNLTRPVEVAHFNNKTGNPPGFVGVWEVYPYFASGKIIMSSMEDGLFVTKFNYVD